MFTVLKTSSAHRSTRPGAARLRGIVALVAGVALVAAGCTADKSLSDVKTPSDTATGRDGPAEPKPTSDGQGLVPDGLAPELVPFYEQTLTWEACEDTECATISAPLDWDDPAGGETVVALERNVASGQAQGSLLINPGGPGASGIGFLDYAVSFIGSDVLENFHIVAFDPRGVGASAGVQCLDAKATDAAMSRDYANTPEGHAQMEADAKAFGEACLENTGALLGNVDTQSAAKDMDLIRALVGDEKLNYLGYSYGTQLGAAYAGLFPANVGRLVLDGAVDITLDDDASNLEQAAGFERALRNYVTDCQGARCPLTGSVDDGLGQIKALVDRAFDNPLPTTSDRRLTSTLAFYGIAVTLYDDSSWPYLTQGLNAAIKENDGTVLLALADMYNDRNADGTFSSNSFEAFRAIGCLDSRGNSDPEHMAKVAAQILEVAPTMGASFAYGALGCKNWPEPEVVVDYDISAPGAAPIMVIGTSDDPATPYEWAQALTKTLDSAVLVTWEGEGHTAYGRSNDCIANAVEGYLLEGTVPADGLIC